VAIQHLDRLDRVAGIAIGADLVRPILRHGRTADDDKVFVVQPLVPQQLDHVPLKEHRRREQRGHGNDVGPGALGRLDKARRGHLDAHVAHVVAVRLQHCPDDRLANVVNVPLDRAQDDHALLFQRAAAGLHRLVQHVHARLHRVGGHHQLGQENLHPVERLAQLADRLGKTLLHGHERVQPRSDGLLSRRSSRVPVVLLDAGLHPGIDFVSSCHNVYLLA